MERDTVSPPNKKWSKEEVVELFKQGKTFDQVKLITGLPGRVVGGYKGLLRSPIYSGEPVTVKENAGKEGQSKVEVTKVERMALTPSEPNGGAQRSSQAEVLGSQVTLEAGPGDAAALTILLGKPYLIRVQNVYVSPDALKCYQVLVARGFKGSVGDFFELCVLKTFKELYGLVPGMIRPEVQPS